MPSRDLPARPSLDHLRNEAKALHRAVRVGDADALRRVQSAIGDRNSLRLTDAQRAIAREYGFTSWARLRTHVMQLTDRRDPVAAFLAAVQAQDAGRASKVLAAQPRIVLESLHVASVLGRTTEVERLLRQNPSLVNAKDGDPAASALLFLCFSPFHGESAERDASLLATAKMLLDAGADPNAQDGKYGVPALYAVTGLHSVIPLARLLLERGANPTDGESIFHAAELFHLEALELLRAAGADLNYVGDWGNTAIYFLLRWHDVAREPRVSDGFTWLLAHGADPNVRCGSIRENALHLASRRGQSPSIVQQLLDYGADVQALRGDGASAWLLARRAGFDEIAALLEGAGATPEPLTELDALRAACGRGDAAEASRLSSARLVAELTPEDLLLLPEAAASSRSATALACLAAGFPVDALESSGATALHYAALHGHAPLVRALLDAGARLDIRDREHTSTALGWACFGADFVKDSDGQYAECVLALLEGGATLRSVEHRAAHLGVQSVLERWSPR